HIGQHLRPAPEVIFLILPSLYPEEFIHGEWSRYTIVPVADLFHHIVLACYRVVLDGAVDKGCIAEVEAVSKGIAIRISVAVEDRVRQRVDPAGILEESFSMIKVNMIACVCL